MLQWDEQCNDWPNRSVNEEVDEVITGFTNEFCGIAVQVKPFANPKRMFRLGECLSKQIE